MKNEQDEDDHKIYAGWKQDGADNLKHDQRYGKLANDIPCCPEPIRNLKLKWKFAVSFEIAFSHDDPSFVHLG